jgi:hypothetical protein
MSAMKKIIEEVQEMYYGEKFATVGTIAKELNIPVDLVFDALVMIREMEMENVD